MDNFQKLALEVFLRKEGFKYDSYDDKKGCVTWIKFLAEREWFEIGIGDCLFYREWQGDGEEGKTVYRMKDFQEFKSLSELFKKYYEFITKYED